MSPHWSGVVISRMVPARVSVSPLVRGSNLRGRPKIFLELFYSATITNTHSLTPHHSNVRNFSLNRFSVYQLLYASGLEPTIRQKRSKHVLTILISQIPLLMQEGARAAVLSKSENFINGVLEDATSMRNLTEEECQEQVL
ncbi:hypothetical protein TNCV_3768671 [Trichonephila clavipes]|nr:hypothetical protein TNCV_3768671 [Trichonephila clavipes]